MGLRISQIVNQVRSSRGYYGPDVKYDESTFAASVYKIEKLSRFPPYLPELHPLKPTPPGSGHQRERHGS